MTAYVVGGTGQKLCHTEHTDMLKKQGKEGIYHGKLARDSA